MKQNLENEMEAVINWGYYGRDIVDTKVWISVYLVPHIRRFRVLRDAQVFSVNCSREPYQHALPSVTSVPRTESSVPRRLVF